MKKNKVMKKSNKKIKLNVLGRARVLMSDDISKVMNNLQVKLSKLSILVGQELEKLDKKFSIKLKKLKK